MGKNIKCVIQCKDNGDILFEGSSNELLRSKYADVMVEVGSVSITDGNPPIMWIRVNKSCLPN